MTFYSNGQDLKTSRRRVLRQTFRRDSDVTYGVMDRKLSRVVEAKFVQVEFPLKADQWLLVSEMTFRLSDGE